MSRTPGRIALGMLFALLALLIGAWLRYPGKATVKLPPADCNADLWQHVYSPDRLRVIEACTAVEGSVVSLHQAKDGDLHIALDPDHKSVLNLINLVHGKGNLAVEIICDHPAANQKAASACAGFASLISAPRVGDRVRITGAYVTDRDDGWNEIHPVTRIEILR